jgi:hypothetical protein
MLTMLIFGGLLLKEVFYCDACLWFAVGTQHAGEVSTASNVGPGTSETVEVSAKGYTGTVQNALNFNSAMEVTKDTLGDNCGVWVLHPNHWKNQPGKQIEFDITVGETPVVLGGALGLAGDGSIRAKPLSDAQSESSCKVSLGDDGQLRNWVNSNELITDGNCNKVRWVDDTQDAGSLSDTRDVDDAILNRNKFGIIGLCVFITMRLVQYIALFQALGSESDDAMEETDGCIHACFKAMSRFTGLLFAIFDWAFYSQFPALVLEPITGINFLDHCNAVMTLRFSPLIWLAAVIAGGTGLVFHVVDIFFAGLCEKKNILWQFIMFVLGSVLTLFVVVIKIIQIMRYGFSMLFNVKVEWAFKIEFWPLQVAVNLDMLQLFCFLFFTYDLFFSAIVNYYKYMADPDVRQDQAGWLGEKTKKAGGNSVISNAA